MMPGEPFIIIIGIFMKLMSFVDILVTNQLWLHKVQSLTQVGQEDFGFTIYNVLEEKMNYWIVQE